MIGWFLDGTATHHTLRLPGGWTHYVVEQDLEPPLHDLIPLGTANAGALNRAAEFLAPFAIDDANTTRFVEVGDSCILRSVGQFHWAWACAALTDRPREAATDVTIGSGSLLPVRQFDGAVLGLNGTQPLSIGAGPGWEPIITVGAERFLTIAHYLEPLRAAGLKDYPDVRVIAQFDTLLASCASAPDEMTLAFVPDAIIVRHGGGMVGRISVSTGTFTGQPTSITVKTARIVRALTALRTMTDTANLSIHSIEGGQILAMTAVGGFAGIHILDSGKRWTA